MAENSKLGQLIMYSDDRSSNLKDGKTGEKIARKLSFSDHSSCSKSDRFVVDMAHLMDKDINNTNSRITLQRNISRKGSVRNGDLKINGDNRETVTTSPKGTKTAAGSTPEKPGVVAVGPANHSHHQITITGGSPAAEGKSAGRRFGLRRAQPVRICDSKRILFLFATL
ncbi:DNA-directed RNA polymerase subunit beta [Striga asiatica]|uniref:DNA-directed RNA polymerase subunit beta n=1 Tax=Striga asiatica TaxID=4170 RepID=A0A5A7R6S1_STRAF|nr:DNA-directed RNA polymerase subunit beta [Striga asiatica]